MCSTSTCMHVCSWYRLFFSDAAKERVGGQSLYQHVVQSFIKEVLFIVPPNVLCQKEKKLFNHGEYFRDREFHGTKSLVACRAKLKGNFDSYVLLGNVRSWEGWPWSWVGGPSLIFLPASKTGGLHNQLKMQSHHLNAPRNLTLLSS